MTSSNWNKRSVTRSNLPEPSIRRVDGVPQPGRRAGRVTIPGFCRRAHLFTTTLVVPHVLCSRPTRRLSFWRARAVVEDDDVAEPIGDRLVREIMMRVARTGRGSDLCTVRRICRRWCEACTEGRGPRAEDRGAGGDRITCGQPVAAATAIPPCLLPSNAEMASCSARRHMAVNIWTSRRFP